MAQKNLFGRKILSLLLAAMLVVGMVGTAMAAPGWGGMPGWGGGYVLDEAYYVGSRTFGWDTYTEGAKLLDEDNQDVYSRITVSVGDEILSKGVLNGDVSNADVVANGVTVSNIPAGFYISAYKIVCEKYACYTDQAGNATDETVTLDAGKGTYSVSVSKADMGHANTGAKYYWILLELSAYEQEQETVVTYPYSVLYNYGELAEELAEVLATVDSNTYAMNATATVLSPAAVEAAAALGYRFLGWEVESVRGSFAVTNGVVGTLVDPTDPLTITGETTLKALWEKVAVPTYDIGYAVEGPAPETHSGVPAAEFDVEVGTVRTVAAPVTTTETTHNGVVGTWTFHGWSTSDVLVSNGAFAMPDNHVEFVGTWSFEAAPTYGYLVVAEYYTNNVSDASKTVASVEGVLALPTAADVEAAYSAANTVHNDRTYTYTAISVADGVYTLRYDRAVYEISYRVEGETPASYSDVPGVEAGVEAGAVKTVKAGLTTVETTRGTRYGTWVFSGWTTEDAQVVDGSFEMPAANVVFVGTWTFKNYVPTPTDDPIRPEPDPVHGEEELEELEDEDVPLADVPPTGGITGLFIALTAVSGAGLLALNRKKKEEEA